MAKSKKKTRGASAGADTTNKDHGTAEPNSLGPEVVTADSWEKIRAWIDEPIGERKLPRHQLGWVFRGQRREEWKLLSSFTREWNRYYKHLHNVGGAGRGDRDYSLENAEVRLIREFKRRYHQYATHLPEQDDWLEWLSIMAHHGAPTRLLDFSYSFYVALFFAVEGAGEGDVPTVWALDATWARGESESRRSGLTCFLEKKDASFQSAFMESPTQFAVTVNPERLTERLTLQKGLFLCPGDVSKTMQENLEAMQPRKTHWVKLEMGVKQTKRREGKREAAERREKNKELQMEIMKQLEAMSVSATVLFPGLDGFARGLRNHYPLRATQNPTR